MREEIDTLIVKIKSTINPSIIATDISSFISESLKKDKISIYEAYMINMEVLKFNRLGYIQSAWDRKVGINQCISILNQKLLAHVFGEDASAENLKEWGIEAYSLYKEKRNHYIMDEYISSLNAYNLQKLLGKLQDYRDYYKDLSFDEGPYHFEVFPYLYFSPEKELLANTDKTEYKKNLSEDIEDLIVELNLI
ncbi:hypothetical protein [Clostridium sp. C8-1-8]|uniref:hypothetical protein n=1 Tax=Clostridium sp. C8-1-8 TaxID=2698831 RepID=UPI001367E578|nr:hypothetical protein [Clostridium sp. C8-1-8]